MELIIDQSQTRKMKDRVLIDEIKGQLAKRKKLMKQELLEKSDKLKQLCIIKQEKTLKCRCPTVKLKRSSRKDQTCQRSGNLQQLKLCKSTKEHLLKKSLARHWLSPQRDDGNKMTKLPI